MTLYRAIAEPVSVLTPLFQDSVPAGFPSPAQDYVEKSLDLNELCIKHPSATYFIRVAGTSMVDANISDGDLLIVDSALKPVQGHIVVAAINGEFTVKKLQLRPDIRLLPMNPSFSPIVLRGEEELEIFGVVTFIIYAAA